jgi:F-BAR domain only protein
VGTGDPGADAGSIRSGRSLASTGSQAHKHPELHEPGLISSIVETVSAHFENGALTSSSLVGEVALAYNPTDFSSAPGSETIRLENFGSLEKVAPNPGFINQTPDKQGEYSVNLSTLGKQQVAFKYQVHADDLNTHAPLLITPIVRFEAKHADIMVHYSLNPSFDFHGRDSVTLSNVAIAITIQGAQGKSRKT